MNKDFRLSENFHPIPSDVNDIQRSVELTLRNWQDIVDALLLKYDDYHTVATDELANEDDREFAARAADSLVMSIKQIQAAVGYRWVDTDGL